MRIGCSRFSLHSIVSALLLPLLAAWTCPARAQLLGPEFRVNSHTPGSQRWNALAADASGNFIVVWTSYGQDGSYDGVFGQRFDADGLPLGSEFQVNSHTTGSQRDPAVAVEASGGFVVVWTSIDWDGSYGDVFGQRFDSEGLPTGTEFQVNTYTTDYQIDAEVAANGAGGFVVVWESNHQDGSVSGVFGQRFDSAGLPVGAEFQVNTFTTYFQEDAALAATEAGDFVVVWSSSSQDGFDDGVFGQRFDSAGLPVGAEFQVNTYTPYFQDRAAVSANGGGNFVVVWTSDDQDGSFEGVFGQRFDSIGLPVGVEFQVNTYTGYVQTGAAVAANDAGDFIVAWTSIEQDGSGSGVFGQQFSSAGFPVGTEFRVNSFTTDFQYSPALAAGGPADFVVSWGSFGQDGQDGGVFARQWRIPYFADGFEAGDACAWSAAVGGGCP
jgi:hypothetical protein